MTSGHVFLVRGDLRSLQCDAIGYSGNPHNEPSTRWRSDVTGQPVGPTSPIGDGRVVTRWSGTPGEPVPYVVPVAGTDQTPIPWYLDALSTFLRRATDDLKNDGKATPKLAIPLLGASKGGQERAQGELLQKTLQVLWAFAHEHGVDVVLVLDDDKRFDAAQWHRRKHGPEAWRALPSPLLERADALAALAARGDLALFLGAGVSMGAGLPSWWSLLEGLAAEVLTPQEVVEARRLSTLDFAQLLARLMGEQTLRTRVLDAIRSHHRASVAHALLATLPVREIATTNYDALFELAAEKAGNPVHVIPYKGTLSRDVRWLLKLHGSIESPDDIVLSRQTFLQYEASRAALAGLLAGVLLTRHVLFVGSSFSDDNVLRITEEVQRLGRPASTERTAEPRLGTCLAIGLPSVQKKLWEGDFAWVDFGNDVKAGSRQIEIFLDRMLASTSASASYLFDPYFAASLSGEERTLRDRLEGLLRTTEGIEHPAVATLLEQLRQRLGWKRG